jgi:uncharacterized protein
VSPAALPAASFVCGLLFAIGLGISGMTNPAKILGFLDVTGAWDPSLAFVMMGGIGMTALAWRLRALMRRPLFASAFPDTSRCDIDPRLTGGAVLFGVGWGLVGYCPGPAVTVLSTGAAPVLVFAIAMLAGMAIFSVRGRAP